MSVKSTDTLTPTQPTRFSRHIETGLNGNCYFIPALLFE